MAKMTKPTSTPVAELPDLPMAASIMASYATTRRLVPGVTRTCADPSAPCSASRLDERAATAQHAMPEDLGIDHPELRECGLVEVEAHEA
jgi:hypothetical protein